MPQVKSLPIRIALVVVALPVLAVVGARLASHFGSRPTTLGVADGGLAACPPSPNCVSSLASASDEEHHIAPLRLPPGGFQTVVETAKGLDGAVLVTASDGYAHLECTTRVLGFVDDLELQADDGRVHVRSASRVGRSDLGVNRSRVERLRRALPAQ